MAEVAGLALGSVALVPLIKNVRHIYDSIKDAPRAPRHYRDSISRLLDTLEVINITLKKQDGFLENHRLKLAFEGYLTDINNSCLKLENLLNKKLSEDGRKFEVYKRVLWSLLGRDEKAKELMSNIERTARSLHLLFDASTSIVNSAIHDTHTEQLTISANAWITSSENTASILTEITAIKMIIEESLAGAVIRNCTNSLIKATNETRVTDLEAMDENDGPSSYGGATAMKIYQRRNCQPVQKKSIMCYTYNKYKGSNQITTVLSKTQSVGRQSGIILRSKYEIRVGIYSMTLGVNIRINLGLDISSRSLYPMFGLHCQRIIPENDIQYYYVKNHMFEEFRDLVVQGRASVHDRYELTLMGPRYTYHRSRTVIELLCNHEVGHGNHRTYEFLTFLLQEGYKVGSSDTYVLISRGECSSVRLLVSEGSFEWSLSYLNECYSHSGVAPSVAPDWGFLWSPEWPIESELADDDEHRLRWIVGPFVQRPTGMIKTLLNLDGIWSPEVLCWTANLFCNILWHVGEEVALGFLVRILPILEGRPQFTDKGRYIIVLAALFCKASDILVFLLRRGYPFRNTARFNYMEFGNGCGHLEDLLCSAAVATAALGEQRQMVWERCLKSAFPEVDAQEVFAEDYRKVSSKMQLLLSNCWNCKCRRSFVPDIGFCEVEGRVTQLPRRRSCRTNPLKLVLCWRCDFSTLACPNCGEIPLGLQEPELSDLTWPWSQYCDPTLYEDELFLTLDPDRPSISTGLQAKNLSLKLFARFKWCFRRLGPSGIFIAVLLITVLYLLYKLNQPENLRRSLLVYNEGSGIPE
ncbi:hypothetical protein TWF718_005475 [Orbilia javanica]|uniref:Fungal N-terminal domain-containing protein n=1 Tax=Orbilia javanica TaxID=47235 RepID=A0AAN8RE86_9PEZI